MSEEATLNVKFSLQIDTILNLLIIYRYENYYSNDDNVNECLASPYDGSQQTHNTIRCAIHVDIISTHLNDTYFTSITLLKVFCACWDSSLKLQHHSGNLSKDGWGGVQIMIKIKIQAMYYCDFQCKLQIKALSTDTYFSLQNIE